MHRRAGPGEEPHLNARARALAALAVLSATALAACTTPGAPAPAPARSTELRWQTLFSPAPDLLIVLRPQAVRRDEAYGPVIRRAIELAREHSRLVAETGALQAMEDAEEVIIGAREVRVRETDETGELDETHAPREARESRETDFVVVVRGVSADVDPANVVGETGHPLWVPGPNGPAAGVRELVRAPPALTDAQGGSDVAADEASKASLFELPGRTWVIATGLARARARDAFSRSAPGPRVDVDTDGDDSALAMVRLSGPALVARVRVLRPPALLAPLGRGLSAVTVLLPRTRGRGDAEIRASFAYEDERAVAPAEATAREALNALNALRAPGKDGDASGESRKSEGKSTSGRDATDYGWLRPAAVRSSRCCVVLTVPLSRPDGG
jgi:hypothetical protein